MHGVLGSNFNRDDVLEKLKQDFSEDVHDFKLNLYNNWLEEVDEALASSDLEIMLNVIEKLGYIVERTTLKTGMIRRPATKKASEFKSDYLSIKELKNILEGQKSFLTTL